MLAGVIRPCVKDKSGNIKSSSNYREIMISSIFYKMFEYCILPCTTKPKVSSSQFGYRTNSSTLLANAILKETVSNYIVNDSSVHACFMYLGKALK